MDNQRVFVVDITRPILNRKKELMAVVGVVVDLNEISNSIFNAKSVAYANNRNFMITENGVMLVNSNSELVGKNLKDINKDEKITEFIKNNEIGIVDYSYNGVDNYAGITEYRVWKDVDTEWTLVSVVPKDEVYAPLVSVERS
ncbi:PDC sensor domain-containing protein [Helicobacter ibis]|uniref:Cache domain-containing protein n=1 Tax=Helicobacter ibis TaxID=2962633 RepID=A0ABT4VHS4_9HELI|nr:hypothetical protein [Helicobacter ibis]MDA3969596.1 hypothetical protein [Helicobacter ibis]